MATTEEIQEVRDLTDGADGFTDDQIGALVDSGLSINAVAYRVWQSTAASYSKLVNVSESGSSRSMGDLYKNALAMAKSFKDADLPSAGAKVKRTRKAVRQ
jgi:hypothetical protein